MKVNTSVSCKFCKVELIGEYCHQCGQKNTGKRLQFLTVIEDFLSNIFSLERSGLATLLSVVKSPKVVIQSYWNGHRRYFESPSKLIVYASIVIGFHIIYHKNLIFGLQFTDQPQGFFIILLLILLSCSSYLTYFRRKYSFLEHLVANIYLFCTWTMLMVLVYELVYYFGGDYIVMDFEIFFLLITLILIYTARVMSRKMNVGIILLNVCLQFLIMTLILITLASVGYFFGDLHIIIDGINV